MESADGECNAQSMSEEMTQEWLHDRPLGSGVVHEPPSAVAKYRD